MKVTLQGESGIMSGKQGPCALTQPSGLLRASTALLTGLYLAGSVSMAMARDETGTTSDDAFVMDEIIVSARKRNESIIDVPDTIVALTSETIENAGIKSIEDVTLLIPNMSFVDTQNAGSAFINIRGIGQYRNGESPIAIVIDGVQLTSTDAINQEFFDIQQIEVLKGPQGALFGRNAVGGAINIVTKKPTNEFEGLVQATYGNGEDIRARALISGPIVEDKVFMRVAGSLRSYGGLIQNVAVATDKIDHLTDRNLRARVLVEANEKLSLDFRASYSSLDSGASGFVAPFDENGLVVDGAANDFSFPVSEDTVGVGTRELQEYAIKADYDMDFATLTSVSAYTNTNEFYKQDLDFSRSPVLEFSQGRKVKAYSEELRLTSNEDGPLQWMVGAYYLNSDRTLDTRVFASSNAGPYFSPDFFAGIIGLNDLDPNATFSPLVTNITLEKSRAWALFGNVNYDVTDTLALTVALRYDEDKRSIVDLQGNFVTRQKTFSLLQPKVQLSYRPNEDLSIYASWGKGFRSGGFNPTDTVRDRYESEEISTAEVGFKSKWFDDRVTVNGAAYYTDFKNRQDFIFVLGNQAILTIPNAKVIGVELEVQAKLPSGFDIFASGGIQDSEAQSEIVGFGPSNPAFPFPSNTKFTGNDLGLVYGWSYAIALQYTRPVESIGSTFVGRIDYSARGDMAWMIDNADRQDSLHLVNARASLDFDTFKATLWVENLFDKIYYTEYFPAEYSGEAADTGFPAQPRRYGITLTARF